VQSGTIKTQRLCAFVRDYVTVLKTCKYKRLGQSACSFALAAPLAWWVINAWLQDYACQVSIGAGIFVISLLTTFGVAALKVGFQSMRAALANPVKSLRSE